jgi:hypothetical protein
VTKGGVKTKVRTRERARIGFGGTAKDPSGVTTVFVTLQRLAKAPAKKKSSKRGAKASAAQTKPKTCTWLDAKQGFVDRACDKPILVKAKVRRGKWAYIVPKKVRFGTGNYRVSAYGTDGAGAFGNVAPKNRRVIRFQLRG